MTISTRGYIASRCPRLAFCGKVAWRSKSPLAVVAIAGGCLYLLIWSTFSSSKITPNIDNLETANKNWRVPVKQHRHSAKLVIQDVKEEFANLEEMLSTYSLNDQIAVSVIDSKYADFAVNFHKSSIDKLKDRCPHVMICLDEESRRYLNDNNIYCFQYDMEPVYDRFQKFLVAQNESNNGDFGTPEYYLKTNMKTYIVLEILELGYSVLLMDVDIVLFQDPFPSFTCHICDIHAAKDRQQINTGFLYVRPTVHSINLYKTVWNMYVRGHHTHDQSYFNIALQTITMKTSGNFSNLIIRYLPTNQFMCGVYYFEKDNHVYGDRECDDCVMIHNNYIGSIAAKRFRFRENKMWLLDTDKYYTSPNRRYLTYDNPYYFDHKTWKKETEALLNALIIAGLSNRVLILPEFHCCNCETRTCSGPIFSRCLLLNMLRLTNFDATFAGQYREHSFLTNPLVPDKVRSSAHKKLLIHSSVYDNKNKTELAEYEMFVYKQNNEPWKDAIKTWLSKYDDERILHFHSMYDVIPDSMETFLAPLRTDGFVCKTYQQWDVDGPLGKVKHDQVRGRGT